MHRLLITAKHLFPREASHIHQSVITYPFHRVVHPLPCQQMGSHKIIGSNTLNIVVFLLSKVASTGILLLRKMQCLSRVDRNGTRKAYQPLFLPMALNTLVLRLRQVIFSSKPSARHHRRASYLMHLHQDHTPIVPCSTCQLQALLLLIRTQHIYPEIMRV